ncbi:hypothetical protein LCGC14_3027010, partial [marine sediment metagenome]
LTFIERFMDLGSERVGGWQNRDLSGNGIAPKSVVEATLLNQEFDINTLGIRTSGSALNRFLILTDVMSSGASQSLTMHTQTSDSAIETFVDDTTKDHQILLLGSWEPTPINDSVVLFIEGHDPISSGVDLITLGIDVYSSGLNLFLASNDTISSDIDLVINGSLINSGNLNFVMPDTKDVVNADVTLYIGPLILSDAGLDLSINGKDSINTDTPLFVLGHEVLVLVVI